jgi:hypothetical protein
VHNLTGDPKGKCCESAHITGESTPLTVSLLFLTELINLLVVETNRNYQENLHLFYDGPSPQTDVTEEEMFAFFGYDIAVGTYSSKQTGGLTDETGAT